MRKTYIIAVTYEKGGVGKTTTSVNVAAILAAKGYKTLIIDLDPQSYATKYFGLYDSAALSLYNVMSKSAPAGEVIRNTKFENLDILPATYELEAIETELAAIPYGQEFILKDALEQIKEKYNFILLDCPPSGMRIKTNALCAAEYLILPTIPDDYAIAGLMKLSHTLNNIKRAVNPSLEVLGILINLDENTANKKAYKKALLEQTIFNCFKSVIRKNTTLSEAINANMPVNIYDINSNGAKDFIVLTDEILKTLKKGIK